MTDGLHQIGIGHGDRVGLLSRNSVEFSAALGAIAELGAIAVPMNPQLTTDELAYQIGDTEPAVILVSQEYCTLLAATLETMSSVTAVRHLAELGDEGRSFRGASGSRPVVEVDPMDPFLILYTSGTTSSPKGVMHSHRSVVEEAHRLARAWTLGPSDVLFGQAPVFHAAGLHALLFAAMYVKADAAFGASFSAKGLEAEIAESQATVALILGPLIRLTMADWAGPGDARFQEPFTNNLRLIATGMALPKEMEDAFVRRFAAPVFHLSGSTEGLCVTYIEPTFVEHRWPSVGRAAADREVILVKDDGSRAEVGERGEFWVKGIPGISLMLGYWNRPEETAKAIVDGWYRTGDIGSMDEDGFFYFVDRKKDLIKKSGENISALEIEHVISAIRGVQDVGVVGRPDALRHEEIVAFVVCSGLGADDIRDHCRKHLAPHKVPADIRLIDVMPRTGSGKIQKRTLRTLAIE
jgi:crotonobetaine/carnitine-CoA ligase